jgi:hypothetical protein
MRLVSWFNGEEATALGTGILRALLMDGASTSASQGK